ncbi:MAG: c-type cytochrome [Chitinophagaceae bacterium]
MLRSICIVLMTSATFVTLSSFQQKTKPDGKALYQQYCLACHQPDGEGVPHLAPPLAGSKVLLGKPNIPIQIVLKGSAAQWQREDTYANPMAAHNFLKDDEIAAILTFVRSNFGNKATPVTAATVAAERKRS